MNILARIGRLLAAAALASAPALLALFLVGRCFGVDLVAFCPAYDPDQFFYTREAATFAAAGFDGGYYGGDGRKAVLGRFGAHGAAYPVVYGLAAKAFGGWEDWLAPACNMVLVALALMVCARRLPLPVFAALAACLTFFPPMVFYLPTAYQDAPQMALGLVLGLALAGLAAAPSRRRLWGVLAGVFLASLTRPTWAVLFPAALFLAGPAGIKQAVRAAVLGGVCLAAAYAAFSLTASPWVAVAGTNPVSSLVSGGPAAALPLLAANLRTLFDFSANRHHTLVLLLMASAVALALAAPAGGRQAWLKGLALHACNFLAPFCLYVAIYNGSGRHLTRLLAAHGALSLAYAAAGLPGRSRSLALAPVLAGGLALFPATVAEFSLYIRPAYDGVAAYRDRLAAQAAAMDPALSLSLGAASPWLRTLAVPLRNMAVPYLAAPPAYGVEIYGPQGLDAPLAPGFALLGPKEHAQAAGRTPLTPVAETPEGTLYRNDAAFGFAPWPGARP